MRACMLHACRPHAIFVVLFFYRGCYICIPKENAIFFDIVNSANMIRYVAAGFRFSCGVAKVGECEQIGCNKIVSRTKNTISPSFFWFFQVISTSLG